MQREMTALPLAKKELVDLVHTALKEFMSHPEDISDHDIEAWLNKRLELIAQCYCDSSCGNWPAKTADECTFCRLRFKKRPITKTCGYCGRQGDDVTSVSYSYVGGRSNVPFPVCDDTKACIERQKRKLIKCERCGLELPRFEVFRRHWETTHDEVLLERHNV